MLRISGVSVFYAPVAALEIFRERNSAANQGGFALFAEQERLEQPREYTKNNKHWQLPVSKKYYTWKTEH